MSEPHIDWSASMEIRGKLWLERSLAPLCPCSQDPSSASYGPQQECPLHGDGRTFVERVRHLEANDAARLLARILDRDREHGMLMPWPEATQDLALIATRLDNGRLRYVGARLKDHEQLSDALGVERETLSWSELIQKVQILAQK